MKIKTKQPEEFNKWWEENIADRYDQIQKRRVKIRLKSQRTQILGEIEKWVKDEAKNEIWDEINKKSYVLSPGKRILRKLSQLKNYKPFRR